MQNLLRILTIGLLLVSAKSENPCAGIQDGDEVNDPSSCESYFKCIHGLPVPSKCTHGLWFNPDTDNCDLREYVSCNEIPTPPHPDFSTDGYPRTTGFGSSTTGVVDLSTEGWSTSASSTENTGNPCFGISDNTFVRDPQACERYFLCNKGVATPGKCAENYVFHPQNQMCDYRDNYDCGNTDLSTSIPPHTGSTNPCTDPQVYTVINDPDSCEGYIECVFGKPVYGTCPDGLWYNHDNGKCDYSTNVHCSTSGSTSGTTLGPVTNEPSNRDCGDHPNHSFFNDPSSCEGFHQCVDGTVVSGKCRNGLWFNPDNGMCDYEENVDCKPFSTPSGQHTDTTPTPTEPVDVSTDSTTSKPDISTEPVSTEITPPYPVSTDANPTEPSGSTFPHMPPTPKPTVPLPPTPEPIDPTVPVVTDTIPDEPPYPHNPTPAYPPATKQ